jgi:uncharacterized protein
MLEENRLNHSQDSNRDADDSRSRSFWEKLVSLNIGCLGRRHFMKSVAGLSAGFVIGSSSSQAAKGRSTVGKSITPSTQALPIIDMHAHAFPANGEKDYYGNPAPRSTEELFQKTYEQFRKWNVVKAVASGSLEHVELWKSKDVDNRIIRGIFMESPDLDHAPREKGGIELHRFHELVKSGKIQVFGEIGAIYGGTTLNDPGWQPYLTICALYDIPVNVHTGDMGPNIHSIAPKARLRLGDPYHIEEVLLRYPKLRVYLAHAGIEDHDHTLSLMKVHPNLYTDVSCLLWINPMCKRIGREFLAKAKEDELLDRVMFGSDQILWPHGIEMSIEYLDSLEFLSDQDKRDILYNNAARFLRLDQ